MIPHTTERIIVKYEKGETARTNGNRGGDILTRIERTIVIEAPVEKVFAFLTDFDNFLKLQQPEMEMEILSRDGGPQRVGYTVKARAKVGGQVWEFDFETTEFVKNKRYAGRQKGGPMKKLESRDLFEPTDGGTRWTSTVEYELPYSILGKILDKLRMRKIMEEGADYNVEKAKELLEKE